MAEYAAILDGVVHEPTQAEGEGFDLTAAEIYDVTEPGRVDFGGGELAAAGTEPHPTEKRNPEDDYEWWHLDAGTYLLAFNESIAPGADVRLTVRPRTALLERGAAHPTLRVTDLPRVPLAVGGAGLHLKENARASTLVDVDPV